jgi:predicted permease
MSVFVISILAVLSLLLVAIPGYLFIKLKVVPESSISGFSKVLLFVCSPCLSIYGFASIKYSPEVLLDIGIFALLCVAIFAVMMGVTFLILFKKSKEPIYRIITIAAAFSNATFFGIPILEAIMKEAAARLVVYANIFSLVLNVVAWTAGLAIILRNPKYMSVKKAFLNPSMIGTLVAFIIFLFSIPIPDQILSMITTTGKMASPLSMIILGMRLATVDLREMIRDIRLYMTIGVNQLIMPLVALAMVIFLPVSADVKAAFFIICSCPIASNVLNFSEIANAGQKQAASLVLLGTILSILTLPLMMLLLPVI